MNKNLRIIVPMLWLNLSYSAHNAGHEISKWIYMAISVFGLLAIAYEIYKELKKEKESR